MKVTVNSFRNRLRLRWTFEGKRHCISLGVEDTPANRIYAEQKAKSIELDIVSGNFDRTLIKYKPRILGNNATELTCPKLFERFSQHKLKNEGVSPRSIETRYRPLQRSLERSLNINAHEVTPNKAKNFAAICTETLTGGTAKARIWLLHSCFEWAKGKYHLPQENPWQGLANGIKPTPTQKVKPFSIGEIQTILIGFQNHPHYHHYADFVAFLFGTGCRFGEAAGLKWQHLGSNFETAWIGESISRGHHKSTKTGKARTIVLSPNIQAMLRSRKERLSPLPNALVFPAPRGGQLMTVTFPAEHGVRYLIRVVLNTEESTLLDIAPYHTL